MEVWKAVVGFEGRYEVSDWGRVRSMDRTTPRRNHLIKLSGKVLKAKPNAQGYPAVSLFAGSRLNRKERSVHRLVLLAFVGEPPHDHEALHGDGTRANNRLENLRWGTRSENIADTHKTGTHRSTIPNPRSC